MARAERWEIASDAELVKRGRILTILGVIILCLGSLVTVALMSATDAASQGRTGGPLRIAAPQVAQANPQTPQTPGGGSEVAPGSSGAPQGPSNVDPSLAPAPGKNIIGLPITGAAVPARKNPPRIDNEIHEL